MKINKGSNHRQRVFKAVGKVTLSLLAIRLLGSPALAIDIAKELATQVIGAQNKRLIAKKH